jgi:hypothetical protein
MNIFYVDRSPVAAAQALCDKHVVKMVLESAQIMCTVLDGKGIPAKYKATHRNHPCTVWASKSRDNFNWLARHALSLANEYEHRYGREHKSKAVILECMNNLDVASQDPNVEYFLNMGFSEPPLAMPEVCKIGNAVDSYRNYYVTDKMKNIDCRWTNRTPPTWLI